MLSVADLRARLPVGRFGAELHYYPSIGSTNDRAKELAAAGAPEGTLVVADEQTAGRGRAGRRWQTPAGSGLALSLVLRPGGLAPLQTAALGAVGAMGCIEALLGLGLEPQLKWPNDVLLGGAKVGGILAEAGWVGSTLDYLVLGIGLNVRPVHLPVADFPATSVEQALGRPIAREPLLQQVLAGTDRWYARLLTGTAHPAWEAHLAYRGEQVSVSNGNGERVGTLLGLTPHAGLRLELEGGQQHVFEAGPHQLRPMRN